MSLTGEERAGSVSDSLQGTTRQPHTADGQTLHVLTWEAVKAGIGALKSQRIHEHFPAYLHLRKLAVASGSLTNIEPEWRDVSDLLKMPGGPPTKPHYRPFSSVNRKDESGYWYNRNLPGSYAPRSMRTTSRFMLNADGDGYELPDDHVQQALTRLLKETRVPAWALAAYYLRNYGFGYTAALAAAAHEIAYLVQSSQPGAPELEIAVSFWRALVKSDRRVVPAEVLQRSGQWAFVTGLPDEVWAELTVQTLEITGGNIDLPIEVADRCKDAPAPGDLTKILVLLLGQGEPWERDHVARASLDTLRSLAQGQVDESFWHLRTRLIELGYHQAAEVAPENGPDLYDE